MPLLDHFRPPLSGRRHWEGFHSRWASALADDLNQHWLPENFFAEPQIHLGEKIQVDVAAVKDKPWVTIPAWLMPAFFPDTFEVQVFQSEGGPILVAAVELVSPGNKDRPETRRVFAATCASYLSQGIHLIIVDVVTSRLANLHNELMQLLQAASSFYLAADASLYAVAYRPRSGDSTGEIAVWHQTLAIGQPLPVLPLGLTADLTVPMDLEATYMEACQRLRLV